MVRSFRRSVAAVLVIVGCTGKTEKPVDSVAYDTVHTDTVTGSGGVVGQGFSIDSVPSPGTSFTIAPDSYGPLRIGMTVAEAAAAMGGGLGAPRGYSGGCGYAVLTKAPAGLAIMLQDGRIARFEVRSGGITTTEGARIGDDEARIKSLYGSRVATTPHKYLQGGHYLTVTPSRGSPNRIVFETDGRKVTELRSGRVPEVEQVERCG